MDVRCKCNEHLLPGWVPWAALGSTIHTTVYCGAYCALSVDTGISAFKDPPLLAIFVGSSMRPDYVVRGQE